MSYILDALKKSEQQRLRSKGGSIHAPMIAPYAEKSNSFLMYVLIAIIFIGLTLLVISMQPWRHDQKNPVRNIDETATAPQPQSFPEQAQNTQTNNPIAAPIVRPMVGQIPAPTITPNVKMAKRISKEAIQPTPAKSVEAAHETTASKANEKEIAAPQATQATQANNSASEKSTSTEDTIVSESHSNEISLHNRLLEISELPQDIQQDIPDISIAGYVFSENPKERSVGINGRLLQEGDYLKQGVRLVHIAPEGLIFSYKDYHFRQSLQ
ncbi:MAG: general secretion pathway protein GspB [Methylophilaceae bacterium]